MSQGLMRGGGCAAALNAAGGGICSGLKARRTWLERWLRLTALPVWWMIGSDHERGGFFDSIVPDGTPSPSPKRARVQARQIYVFSYAASVGWTIPSLATVREGLTFFLKNYRRRDGLFRTLVDHDGRPLSDEAPLYDQAFAIFSLAHASRALGDPPELADIALQVKSVLEEDRSAPAGGFTEVQGETPFQANPHMHLLEAALAWIDLGRHEWWDLAAHVAELARERLIDQEGGFVREFFDSRWYPAEGPGGRTIEPGHQFEWAWLLKRWGRKAGDPQMDEIAGRLYRAGLAGLDRRRNVVIDALWDDLSICRTSARLWPQTERIKAPLILAEEAHGSYKLDLLKAASNGIDGLKAYLDDPFPGGWRDSPPKRRGVSLPAPATSLYHIVGAITEVIRVVDGLVVQ